MDGEPINVNSQGSINTDTNSSKCSIFKVRSGVYEREVPRPRMVAIGPYNRCNKDLKFTDDKKRQFLQLMADHYGLDPKMYRTRMRGKELAARECYSEDLNGMDSEAFLEMLLLDSCFLLIVTISLNKLKSSQRRSKLNYSLRREIQQARTHMERNGAGERMKLTEEIIQNAKLIKLDLLAVDNQIPLFAVKKLFGCFANGALPYVKDFIVDLALSVFDDLYPKRNRHEDEMSDFKFPHFHHLLHLFHWSRVPSRKYRLDRDPTSRQSLIPLLIDIPSAVELQAATTKLKKADSGSFLDITFGPQKGVNGMYAHMRIPELRIHDYSGFIFQNLIAFEKKYLDCGLCVTSYSACMARFLQSEEDAKLLRKRGILINMRVTDKDVVELFRHFNYDVEAGQMPEDLYVICSNVIHHHKSQRRRLYRQFIRYYCSNPWITVSVIGALLLFILTVLQTTYTILGYYRA